MGFSILVVPFSASGRLPRIPLTVLLVAMWAVLCTPFPLVSLTLPSASSSGTWSRVLLYSLFPSPVATYWLARLASGRVSPPRCV
jgi:hypothetical protein